MIRIRHKGIIALGAGWLITMVCAYQVGERSRPPAGIPSASARPAQYFLPTGDPGSPGAGDFNETRRMGIQNRFVTFAQTLGGDQLARILPEMTDKMTLKQVQSTLRRLFEEVPPGPTRRIARFELIRRWAQLDPGEAFAHIAELNDPKMRHDLRLKGIEGWASVAPAAALEFALETDEDLVAKSKEAVRTGFAATRDLDSALAFVSTLASQNSPDQAWTVNKAVEALYHNDDLAVITWVEKLRPGPVRDQAATGMISQWARHDLEAATRWIDEHVEPAHLARFRELVAAAAQ